ncbi:MAG: saccharopine dehydrogenase NADP-binding domain-containing protein [Pseudorhodoferax sp.]
MAAFRVLVLGGYGFFGRRLVQRLNQFAGLELIVAGRSRVRGQALVDALASDAVSKASAMQIDVGDAEFSNTLKALRPAAVVHTCGPFQGQAYRVAQACIAAGAHYIDLADGREFVCGIAALDSAARAAGVAVISGASSVPALSGAAADQLAQGMDAVSLIDIGISPGNRTERGLSTVQAILSYCGRPLPSAGSQRFGWVGRWRHAYPAPVGQRLLSPCDVPDLTLLPPRHPGRPDVRFGAGLELPLLHWGMNGMAALARWGWVRDWSRHARALKRMADCFRTLGSDAGAMHVRVTGRSADGNTQSRLWTLLASDGDGPFVPTLAAAALVRRLQSGNAELTGAKPCIGLLSLDDFARECAGLRIRMGEFAA